MRYLIFNLIFISHTIWFDQIIFDHICYRILSFKMITLTRGHSISFQIEKGIVIINGFSSDDFHKTVSWARNGVSISWPIVTKTCCQRPSKSSSQLFSQHWSSAAIIWRTPNPFLYGKTFVILNRKKVIRLLWPLKIPTTDMWVHSMSRQGDRTQTVGFHFGSVGLELGACIW